MAPLGRGAMGLVYEAFDPERNRRVAVKSLRHLSPQALLRFKGEFRVLRDLRHPNLVRLGELVEERGEWLFSMELVEGPSLLAYVRGTDDREVEPSTGTSPTHTSGADILTIATPSPTPGADPATTDTRESVKWSDSEASPTIDLKAGGAGGAPASDAAAVRPRYDEGRLRDALGQLTRGLIALHRSGIVHRDIKPANILVGPGGRVVILDLGVAMDGGDTLDRDRIIGTLAYMAPEQAAGERVEASADWYAVGAILYEVLTGQPPYVGGGRHELLQRKHVEDPAPVELVVPDAPPDLARLCSALLIRDPRRRAGGAQILAALGLREHDDDAPARDDAPFVGRKAELAALERAYDRCRAGAFAAASLEGPSGIGKSATLARFLDEAKRRDTALMVLRGRCHEQEAVPYRAFDRVLDDLARALSRLSAAAIEDVVPSGAGCLVQLFPTLELVDRFALLSRMESAGADTPTELRRRAFEALRSVLVRLTEHRRVVIAIDDVQWADEDSLALLAHLVADPAPPVLLLMTARPDAGGAACAAIETVGERLQRLALTGLGEAECLELITAVAGPADLEGANARRLMRATSGHPMFLEELARNARDGAEGHAPSLDDVLWRRVRALPGDSQRILEVVAVAGEPLVQSTCASVAELAAEDYAREVDILRDGKLVRITGTRRQDLIEPFHDRIQESIYARLEPQRRQRMHRRLAEALEAADAASDRIARHYERSGDAARASVHYERAARTALASLAFEHAARAFRAAASLSVDQPARVRALLRALGDALADAGQPRGSAAAYTEAAELAETSERERADLERLAAQQLLQGGYFDEGLAATRAVLARVGVPYPKSQRRAMLHLVWNLARLRVTPLRWSRRSPEEVPDALRARSDVLCSAGVALGLVDSLTASRFVSAAPFLALRTGDDLLIARSLLYVAFALCATCQRRQARRVIDAIARAADSSGHPLVRFYVELAETCYAFQVRTDWQGALDGCERSLACWREAGRGVAPEYDVTEQYACWSLANLGQYQRSRQRVVRLIERAEACGQLSQPTSLRTYMSRLWLLDDVPDDVTATASETIASWDLDGRAYTLQRYWAVLALTHAALYRGDVEAQAPPIEALWREFDRAPLRRLTMVFAEGALTQGRFFLTRAAEAKQQGRRDHLRRCLAEVDRCGRALRRSPLPAAVGMRQSLDAGVAHLEGRHEACLRLLEELRATGGVYGVGAALRLAELRGGDEGAAARREADAWFTAQGARNPERLAMIFSPGWPHPG